MHCSISFLLDIIIFLIDRGRSGSEAGESAPLQFDNPSYHTEDGLNGQVIQMSEKPASNSSTDEEEA